MLHPNDDRTITANVDEVLTALRKNLAEHREIVAEARKGYVKECEAALEKARETLARRLSKLTKGEKVDMTSIHFNLTAPEDHSKEFDTVIKMLELHKNAHEGDKSHKDIPATITLKAIDVQRFVLNDWSWMDSFLLSNSAYSGKSRTLAAEKGLV